MTEQTSVVYPEWHVPQHVKAFTTTRLGGVSEGSCSSLNVGLHVGDNPQCVEANRDRVPYSQHIHWLNQTHSSRCIALPSNQHTADASYTSTVNVACAVMTADCLPLLMTDGAGSTVAAVHAGYEGLRNGIIAKTINQAFDQVPRANINVWIGPAIGVCHYEVSVDMAGPFLPLPNAVKASPLGSAKRMLDLKLIASHQLTELGLTRIIVSQQCTYCDDQRFFSYRRATHQGDSNCGRMVSVICKLG
ncbi:peptidoglycan editing factor PgeF [Alteromonas oceanisediminis]|uniref:peptidoglycan editing factor PgeF n=1 Tax=Alteromonas oceanisediminis TaxID=2836180 RepID=UPI001BDA1A12|nr:peptidoglycan editing factor PgeF [Alteromonas oceanisediminis]MBT0585838.1 peptidoglycan editing factor PgeF [Alteromonas oceanisediminis]